MNLRYSIGFCLLLVGCDGDGIKNEDPDERMTREAMCVVASERFQLYDQAERHRTHGIEAGRVRFNRDGKPNDFTEQIHKARPMMNNFSKDYNANFLNKLCDRTITVGEFERA
ncbi:MAG: hypothetical protein DRQ64_09605 [Gammaproteobacteria bacterium]|nr:MAG: hypothetical protein DRQ64_09605 [Gammaproteobacteria bacterium]